MQLELDYTAARAARDNGMRRALEHAEREHDGWKHEAYEALVAYARTHREFTSEQFRADTGMQSPTTPKAFGAVFQRAARAGVITKRGFAIAKERHLSPCPLWESQIFAGAAA